MAPPNGKHWIWDQDRIDAAMSEGRLVFTSNTMVRVKRYLDESRGNPMEDIWVDIPPINAVSRERIGYPTQKPLPLYERMIRASSNEGDVMLDPFAGCATTCVAAERLQRQWVGIDIWDKAHEIVVARLEKETGLFGEVHHENGAARPHGRRRNRCTFPAGQGTREGAARQQYEPRGYVRFPADPARPKVPGL